MAKQRFKGALAAASFPMVSTLQPRTVVNPQLDINVRSPRSFDNPASQTDYSIPQVCYCENVAPTAEGMQSVGFNQVIAPFPAATDFDQAIILRDADEINFVFSPAGGKNYLYSGTTGAWVTLAATASAAGRAVSRAYVNGRTFICYSQIGIFEYDSATGLLNQLVLTGLLDTEVRGIGSSSNYLLAFTELTVHWSSLVDPVDFVPDLTTGAGFAIPQDVKARITAVLGIAGGYIVYTARNAVAAVYTNNARAPFTFKEVSNAGGIFTYEQVTSEQNSGPHYAWTTGGLQKITIQGAEPISGEVNDFIAGRLWESYDFTTHALTQHFSSMSEFPVKLAYISSRWLVISYQTVDGGVGFNYALLYDTTLRRWGKLKLDHMDCFFYPYPQAVTALNYSDLFSTDYSLLLSTDYEDFTTSPAPDPLSKLSVGFLQRDGTVLVASMDYNKSEEQAGVIVFGKFQLVRGSVMTLQQLDLEGTYESGIPGGTTTTPFVQASLDGFTPEAAVPLVRLRGTGKVAKYAKRISGTNFSITIEGTFAFTSYLMEVTQDGDR